MKTPESDRFVLRRSKDRGHFNHGWLKTYHTFSFGEYHDEEQMGFAYLRVINEDWIEGGEGFPTHGHKDMEIVTYVIEGAIEHRDSTGAQGIIKPGEVQKMSAGSGIRHSEFNALKDQSTHLYQIWFLPNKASIKPKYEQVDFTSQLDSGEPTLLVSPTARDGLVHIHQNVELSAKRWKKKPEAKASNDTWLIESEPSDYLWIQAVKGQIKVSGDVSQISISQGDGLAVMPANDEELESEQGTEVVLSAEPGAEVLVFRMWQ